MSVTLHTNFGDLKIEVFCESVPKTAEVRFQMMDFSKETPFPLTAVLTASQNFLALCASGYYDQSPFHRLIPNFMIQTGVLATRPRRIQRPARASGVLPFEDEIRPTLKHNARGIVSMANKGPATNGSQFFILFDKAAHLDGLNTVFGKLIGDDSLVTLSKLEALEIDKKSRPKEKAFIEKITVHANPLA
ncbi:peptidyl-prolyl cis-trans isomerase 10 [Apiospora hydei]|uniref:Peptidyl-prolyl cis-trans isomerase n=1 Tax=Apiospora hydei TaxID=1337664 RepID=A0ABR1XD62_9PEZI